MTALPASQELAFRPASAALAGVADGLEESHRSAAESGKVPEQERAALRLVADAESYLCKGDGQSALSAAEKAAGIFRELSMHDGVADAVRIMVHVHHHDEKRKGSKPKESIELAKAELAKLKSAKDASKKSVAKMILAVAEVSSDSAEALKMATDAKDVFRSEGDVLMEARTVLAMIDMYIRKSGELKDRGHEIWKAGMDAQDLFSQVGSRRGIALSFHGLAGAHAFRDSWDSATRAAKEALNLFKNLGMKTLEALELETLARFYLSQGEPEQALPFAQRALQAAQDPEGDPDWEVDALDCIVEAQIGTESTAQARRTAEQALKRFHAAGNKAGEASVLHMLAQVYFALDDLTHALTFANEAACKHGMLGCKKGETGSLRLCAQILISKGETEEAVEKARQAVKVAKSMSDPSSQALALRTLMQACVAQGDTDEAMKTANEECTLHRNAGSKQKEALSMLSTCNIHTAAGDFEKAVATAADAQQLIHKIGDAKVEAKAWHTIAEAQISAEKHGAALWALDRAKKLYQESGDKKQAVATRLLIAQANFQQAVHNEEKGGAERDTEKMVENALSEASDVIDLARSQGDQPQVAAALMTLAKAQTAAMLFPDALKAASEAAEVYHKCGDEWGEGSAHALCAHVHMLCERHGRAGTAASQAMLLFQRCRDFQAEAWAAGVFDRISEARSGNPPAKFPQASDGKRTAGVQMVGRGLGLPKHLIFDDPELEFDAPLMQAGPSAGLAPCLSAALAKRIMQERTGAPTLFSK